MYKSEIPSVSSMIWQIFENKVLSQKNICYTTVGAGGIYVSVEEKVVHFLFQYSINSSTGISSDEELWNMFLPLLVGRQTCGINWSELFWDRDPVCLLLSPMQSYAPPFEEDLSFPLSLGLGHSLWTTAVLHSYLLFLNLSFFPLDCPTQRPGDAVICSASK